MLIFKKGDKMAGRNRQPIDLIIAKGKKNLTKAEIEIRRNQEIKAPNNSVEPPSHLNPTQKKEFKVIANQLLELNIISNLDCETLARYIISKDIYNKITKKIRSVDMIEDIDLFEKYTKIHDRYFKLCRASASDLGLTISSRCKLVVPQTEDKPKANKFERFANA